MPSAQESVPPEKKARTGEVGEAVSYIFPADDVDAWLAYYHQEGFVVLRGALSAEAIDSARRGCSNYVDKFVGALAARGIVKDELKQLPLETRFWEACKHCSEEIPILIRPELHEPEFFPLFCSPTLLQAVRQIVSSPELRLFPNYTCRPKTPSGIHDVAWHQDAGLTGSGKPNTEPLEKRFDAFGVGACVNCWTPLVPVNVNNGCMRFVPKSHNEGILVHEEVGTYGGMAGLSLKSDKYVTTINAEDITRLEPKAIDVACEVGDVVLFSQILMHRGGKNTSDHIRWSFDWRFQDASKPTCREHQGHLVHSEVDPAKVVSTSTQWAKLSLS